MINGLSYGGLWRLIIIGSGSLAASMIASDIWRSIAAAHGGTEALAPFSPASQYLPPLTTFELLAQFMSELFSCFLVKMLIAPRCGFAVFSR
jgi:hypothetical protein